MIKHAPDLVLGASNYSETCIKRTPTGPLLVSAYTGCPPNTGSSKLRNDS